MQNAAYDPSYAGMFRGRPKRWVLPINPRRQKKTSKDNFFSTSSSSSLNSNNKATKKKNGDITTSNTISNGGTRGVTSSSERNGGLGNSLRKKGASLRVAMCGKKISPINSNREEINSNSKEETGTACKIINTFQDKGFTKSLNESTNNTTGININSNSSRSRSTFDNPAESNFSGFYDSGNSNPSNADPINIDSACSKTTITPSIEVTDADTAIKDRLRESTADMDDASFSLSEGGIYDNSLSLCDDDDTEGLCFGGDLDAENGILNYSITPDPVERDVEGTKSSSLCQRKIEPNQNYKILESEFGWKFTLEGDQCSPSPTKRRQITEALDYHHKDEDESSWEKNNLGAQADANCKRKLDDKKTAKQHSKLVTHKPNDDDTKRQVYNKDTGSNLTTLDNTQSHSHWHTKDTVFVVPELLADIGCEVSTIISLYVGAAYYL